MPVLECSRCNELYYSAHGSTELSCDACGSPLWRVFADEVSFARVAELPRGFQPGDHGAIVYTELDGAADFCAAYLSEGAARGERLLVVVPADLRAALESRLEQEAALESHVPHDLYADFDPAAVAERFADLTRRSEQPVRAICGPDAESAAAIEPGEWQRYERICHELIGELGATALCVYDGRNLPLGFPPIALESHPLLSRSGEELRRNPDFSYEPAA